MSFFTIIPNPNLEEKNKEYNESYPPTTRPVEPIYTWDNGQFKRVLHFIGIHPVLEPMSLTENEKENVEFLKEEIQRNYNSLKAHAVAATKQ